MLEGDQLRYGWVSGGKQGTPVQIYASERVDAPGSRFVEMTTGAGYASFLDDKDTVETFGHAEVGYGTQSATQACSDVVNCITDITAIYKIPVDTGTYAITDIGDVCNVGVTSYVQGAYLQEATTKHFIILGGDLANNTWVFVRLNPNAQGQVDSA